MGEVEGEAAGMGELTSSNQTRKCQRRRGRAAGRADCHRLLGSQPIGEVVDAQSLKKPEMELKPWWAVAHQGRAGVGCAGDGSTPPSPFQPGPRPPLLSTKTSGARPSLWLCSPPGTRRHALLRVPHARACAGTGARGRRAGTSVGAENNHRCPLHLSMLL